MLESVPIGRNDRLEISSGTGRNGRPNIRFRVLTEEECRGYHIKEAGFTLDIAILGVVIGILCRIAPTVKRDLLEAIQRSG